MDDKRYCSIINDLCPYEYEDCVFCYLYIALEETRQKSIEMQEGH